MPSADSDRVAEEDSTSARLSNGKWTDLTLKTRVVIAARRGRCEEWCSSFRNVPGLFPLLDESNVSSVWQFNIICTPFWALPRVLEGEESSVCVLDGIDDLAEQGPSTQLTEILRVVPVKASRVLATAKTLSCATAELTRKIGFPVLIAVEKNPNGTEQKGVAETRFESCSRDERYTVLKSHLEGKNESVVLVIAKNKESANCLEEELGEDGM